MSRDVAVNEDGLRIGEDHPMHIEKCAELSRRIGALHALMQRFKFGAHGRQRNIKASQLCGDLIGRNVVVRNFQRRMRHQLRLCNRNTRRGGDAVHDK